MKASIPRRLERALEYHEVADISELAKLDARALYKTPGFGRKSFNKLACLLEQRGITLKWHSWRAMFKDAYGHLSGL